MTAKILPFRPRDDFGLTKEQRDHYRKTNPITDENGEVIGFSVPIGHNCALSYLDKDAMRVSGSTAHARITSWDENGFSIEWSETDTY